MKNPKFNNVLNQYIPEINYWRSRATSINAFIFAHPPREINLGQLHVLIIKRSENMDTEPNKYGVPCGYLDWNETLYEAMIREVYEETSLYLPDYEKYLEFDNNKQSFFVDSKPDSIYNKRQNVEHNYITVLDFSKESINQFPTYIENYISDETSLVKWMPLYDFITNNLEWSFGHDQRIKDAMMFFDNPERYYKQIK